MSEANRVKTIDIAKGIAILCIIIGHMNEAGINRVVFTFHVPIFFFITGFFSKDDTPLRPFLRRKAQTLLVPYAAACLALLFFEELFQLIFPDGTSYGTIALRWLYAALYGAGDDYTTPFFIPHIGALWFLLATFWGSLFLRLTAPYRPGMRLALVLGIFAVGVWSAELFWFPFSIQAGMCAVLFMYLGRLLRDVREPIRRLPTEVKAAASLLALGVWICFIRDFRSFWLVHCDLGRGAVDILGCICGCWVLMLLCAFLDRRFRRLSNGLAFLGRHSIMVLCAHMIEMNLFTWWKILTPVMDLGIPSALYIYVKIAGKFLWAILITVLLSRWNAARRLFGMQPLPKRKEAAS